jgi:ubiquinone/menaquinone biosynthesis C-methylase UbiE
LPYAGGTFHAVACLFSLHYWRNGPDAFSEMARALTPGGVLAFSEMTSEDAAADHGRTRRIAKFMTESPSVVDYYRWLDRAGLRVQEAFPTLSRHGLVIIAEKDQQ